MSWQVSGCQFSIVGCQMSGVNSIWCHMAIGCKKLHKGKKLLLVTHQQQLDHQSFKNCIYRYKVRKQINHFPLPNKYGSIRIGGMICYVSILPIP